MRSPVRPGDLAGGREHFLAVAGLFLANGLAVGAYGGSLPGLRSELGLSAGQIVGVLVSAGVLAVLSMNVSGPVSDRRGALVPALFGGGVMVLGLVTMGAAPSYSWLLVGAGLFGLGNGAMDVAMNALGVGVEQVRSRPVMSRLHACFSLGNLGGALAVVLFGRLLRDATPLWALTAAAAGLVLLLLVVAPVAPRQPGVAGGTEGRPASSGLRGVVAVLAAMALCFGLTEGTAIDWSSLHVADVGDVSASAGAWGLACVSGFMVVIRFLGDAVVARLGRARVVQAGSLCALAGYLLTAFTSALPAILLGWCLVGFGVGLIAPQIYAVAGHVAGARGLAVVVSFGYAAFLVGPAIIGFVAAHSGEHGLQRAMLVPVVTAVALMFLSARMPRTRT